MIPDGDRQMDPDVNLPNYHVDVTVTSQMLRLIVSFRWRSHLDGNFIKVISRWTQEPPASSLNPDANYPPNFILIGICLLLKFLCSIQNQLVHFIAGISIHHMLASNGDDNVNYQKTLQNNVKPVLNRLLNLPIRNRPR